MDMTKIKKKTENLINNLGFPGEAIITQRDNVVNINLQIDDPNILIGRGGEGLDALQHILRILISIENLLEGMFLVLDINGYRKKRDKSLENLAKENAYQVRIKRVEIELEPMNSYERRIVHSIISNIADVKSESCGEGRYRRIVIKPKKENLSTN